MTHPHLTFLAEQKKIAWSSWEPPLMEVLGQHTQVTLSETKARKHQQNFVIRDLLMGLGLLKGGMMISLPFFATSVSSFLTLMAVFCGAMVASFFGANWIGNHSTRTSLYSRSEDEAYRTLILNKLMTCLTYTQSSDAQNLIVQVGQAVERRAVPVHYLEKLDTALKRCPFESLPFSNVTFSSLPENLHEVVVDTAQVEEQYVFEKQHGTPPMISQNG